MKDDAGIRLAIPFRRKNSKIKFYRGEGNGKHFLYYDQEILYIL